MKNSYTLTPNLLSEIQIPEKGILSHTIYNDDQEKIILFGFAAGRRVDRPHRAHACGDSDFERRSDVEPGENRCEAGPGCLVRMEPLLTHGVAAKTPAMMLLTLLKAARNERKAQSGLSYNRDAFLDPSPRFQFKRDANWR